MGIKSILISEDLHTMIKAHAALLGETLRGYTERALHKQLANSPVASGQLVFLQSPGDDDSATPTDQ